MTEFIQHEGLPYRWSQTLQDVTVLIPLPPGTKARDLSVVIKSKALTAGLKGQPPLIQGELCKEIRTDESTWSIEDSELNIYLEKSNTQAWWENVVTTAPKIDTTKISPENSKLSDLDGDTRAVVEKLMFDNKQKQLGLPTSDELKKLEAIEKFKKQHPEMDFSKADVL